MSQDKFIALVQAVLSGFYLLCTFIIILIYELGWADIKTPGQEKTFDAMVNWMTGGALIVLYFWLQRAKAQSPPEQIVTTTTTISRSPSDGTPALPDPPPPPTMPE